MSKRTQYHVTYDKRSDQWKGSKTGADRASTVGGTKQQVVNETVRMAKNQPLSQVVIHKQNGIIQEERTFGKDPYPPKG